MRHLRTLLAVTALGFGLLAGGAYAQDDPGRPSREPERPTREFPGRRDLPKQRDADRPTREAERPAFPDRRDLPKQADEETRRRRAAASNAPGTPPGLDEAAMRDKLTQELLKLEAQHRRRLAKFSRLRELAAARGDQKRLDELAELGRKMNRAYEHKRDQLRRRYSSEQWARARQNVALVKADEARRDYDRRDRREAISDEKLEEARRRREEMRRREAGGTLGTGSGSDVSDEERRRRAEENRRQRENDLRKAREERQRQGAGESEPTRRVRPTERERRGAGDPVQRPERDVDRRDRTKRPPEREADKPGRETRPDRKAPPATRDRDRDKAKEKKETPTRERPKRDRG
jgi:hypothetical protein